jgi:photosystem II stability/assembly factor-like uncharacterized protein
MRRVNRIKQKILCRLSPLAISLSLLLSCTTPVWAEYQDLIDLSSIKIDSARYGLALDVVQAGDRLVTVGERGHILFSEDQGQTWTQAEVDTRAHLNAVFFADAEQGWAVGEDAVIVHSADGGRSWTRQFDDRDAGVKGPLLDVWFKNAREGFAIGVYNKIYKTTDGGESWEDWYDQVDNLDEWHLFAITASSDETIYLASEQGLIFRSTDGGESFAPLQTDHYGSFHGILAREGADGQDILLLSGVGGVLYATSNSGETWVELDTGTEAGLSGGTWLEDGSAFVVGYGGMLLHVDAGLHSVSTHPQENGMPLSGVAALADDKLILVGFGGPQAIARPQQ